MNITDIGRYPQELFELLRDSEMTLITDGCSPSEVIRCVGKIGTAFLKISETGSGVSSVVEGNVYYWLNGKLPVPEVYYCAEKNGTEYLLMSGIAGKTLSDPDVLADPERTAKMVAQAMKMVHSVSITDCTFDRTLRTVIAEAKQRAHLGLVDEYDFDTINRGKTASEVIDEIESMLPIVEDPVFTHGDFCLPNILVENEKISGFIDMERAGVADRYQDIALALRSFAYNIGKEKAAPFLSTFIESYGLSTADLKKIRLYQMIDELF